MSDNGQSNPLIQMIALNKVLQGFLVEKYAACFGVSCLTVGYNGAY